MFISCLIIELNYAKAISARPSFSGTQALCVGRSIWQQLPPPRGSTVRGGLGLLLFDFSRSHLIRHSTIGRSSPDECWVRCRDLYLTTHNTHKRQTSMPLAGFETAISESELPHTHTLDHGATGIGAASINF